MEDQQELSPEIKPAEKKTAPKSLTDLLALMAPLPPHYNQFKEAKRFINNIQEGIDRLGKKGFVIKFKCVYDYDHEFFVFYTEDSNGVVILSLTETCQRNTSPADKKFIDIISQKFHTEQKFINRKIIQYIIITPDDYKRAENTICCIYNLVIIEKTPQLSLTKSMLINESLLVCQDKTNAYNFIKKNSPHETISRGDIGFVVYHPNKNISNEPILAVLGFTQFIRYKKYNISDSNTTKIVPIIRISEIYFPPALSQILAIVIPIAAKVFIKENGWRKPFSSFDINNNSDLGKLVHDSQGRPLRCANIQEQNQLIQQYFEQPFLALDTTEGHYSLKGLQALAYNHNEIQQDMATFLEVPQLNKIPFIIGGWEEITGTIKTNNITMDSRMIDYLRLIDQGVEEISASDFLIPPVDQKLRTENILKYYPDFIQTGRTMVNIINGPAVEQMVKALEEINIRYDEEKYPPVFDISALLMSGGNHFDRNVVNEWIMPNNGINPYA